MAFNLGDVKKNKIKVQTLEEQNVKNSEIQLPQRTVELPSKKETISTEIKPFSSNSIVAIKKDKKKNKNISLPIADDLNKKPTNLPVIPKSKMPAKDDSNLLTDIVNAGTDFIGGVAGDVVNTGVQLGKGILDYGEGALDTLLQVGSSEINPYYWFNPDKLKSHQSIAKELIEKDASQEALNTLGYNKKLSTGKTIQETLDDNSNIVKSDNKAGKILENVGEMLPSLMTYASGAGEAGSLTTMAIPSYGGGVEQAYQQGGTRGQASMYGLLNATIEVATEKAFAGIGGVIGKSPLDDAIKDKLTSKISNEAIKRIAEFGINMAGEGTEEVLGDLLQPLAQKITYANEKDLKKLYEDQNYLEDFVSGALSSAVMQGMTMPVNSQSTVKNYNSESNIEDNQEIVKNKGSQINENNANFNENTENNTISPADTKTRENSIKEQTTAPVMTDNSTLNEQITQMRLNEQQNITKSQEKLTNKVNEIDTKVDKLSDTSDTFAQNNKTIEQRVSGDELLDAKDLIEELKSVGAKIDNNGYVTVYHQTTPENATQIRNTGKMISNEQDVFFSTSKEASQSDGRGSEKLEFKIPAEKLLLDDIFSDNADVKISLKGQKSLDISNYLVDNSDNSIKNKQFDIIKETNPMQDDYHTGIRSVNDIKTLSETLNDSDYEGYNEFNPDLTRQDIENAIKKGTITVYSSYPIENGVFISPSKMEAQSYSVDGKVYSKEVNINDVAWIDPTQGQYAKIKSNVENYSNNSKYSFDNQIDLLVNNQWNNNASLILFKETPKLYQELGLNNREITVSPKKMKEIIYGNKNHIGIGIENAKLLPKAISNPLNIIESTTRENSIVAITQLEDANDNIIVAALQIDGFGNIELVDANNNSYIHTKTTNALLSSYGKNTYDNWMEKHKDKIIYDKDDGIIKKRVNGKWVQSPNAINSSISNGTTNSQKSQIATPSKYNMQQKVKNDTKLPTKKKPNIPTKDTINANKESNVLKIEAHELSDELNKLKERKWVSTSTESDVLKGKVLIEDLDARKINYEIQSNKKTLDKANNKLNRLGYEESVKYIKQQINSDKVSLEDIVLAQRVLQEAAKQGDTGLVQDLVMDISIIGTDLGQKTQALSIIKKLTPEGQISMFSKIVKRAQLRGEKSFDNVTITPEMVQRVLDAYDKNGHYDQKDLDARVERFKQDIANQMKTTVVEKIDAWRYLSMLGNPKTHIRNMIGNIAMKQAVNVKNTIARTAETILPVKNRTKTWKNPTYEIMNYSEKTAKEMKDIITGENKYNEKTSLTQEKKIFKNKILQKITDFNGNALEFEDWLFSKSAFEDTFSEYLTANGIKTMEDVKNNPKLIEKAKLYSVEQAEIATFRQYSKLAATMNRLESKSKFGKFFLQSTVPFKKTPINVAKTGVRYSTLGLIKSSTYDIYQMINGNMEASQVIDNISQGLTGTSLMLLGYGLAKAGILTGSGGDKKDDKYDKQLGNTGYSLKIGDNSYSISWLSPVAMPLLVGANAYEQLEEDKKWDMNVVSESLSKTLDPLNEMSFMQSVTKVLSSYDSGVGKLAGIGESTAQNYASQFFPTLLSQIAALTDDTKRSTAVSSNSSYKFGEQTARSIMYKIPGLRQQLEPVTDIWGNDKKQESNILARALGSFIIPYTQTRDISTALDNELKRVYKETGESRVIPGIPNSYIDYKNNTYRLSAKEYTDYKKTYGQTASKELSTLIKQSAYKRASEERKVKMIDNVYKYAKALANEQYFNNIKDVDYSSDVLNKVDASGKDAGIYFATKKYIEKD